MTEHYNSLRAAIGKRIRQACANCRRRKIKCSGERPVCFLCNKNRLVCVYEPYSAASKEPIVSSQAPTGPTTNQSDNSDLFWRLRCLESRIEELSAVPRQQRSLHPTSPITPTPTLGLLQEPAPDALFPAFGHSTVSPKANDPFYGSDLPLDELWSLMDTYFVHVHNQPYSYFEETTFRQRLSTNLLPRCLVLAVAASAARFSPHGVHGWAAREASNHYASRSWSAILTEHLNHEDELSLPVVQTLTLLAVVDYTAGRVSAGWVKIGLAARVSQNLKLMAEPAEWLSNTEQEEQRRTFWSVYLLDRLISCARSRLLAIRDEDCSVQLPCNEQTFRNKGWQQTLTLDQLSSWSSQLSGPPSPFALTILMASIVGRCTAYVHRKHTPDSMPPWDTRSDFSSISSSLLLLESYSKDNTKTASGIIHSIFRGNNPVDQSEVGHVIFAYALFHLCHCLLNHPLHMHLRLQPFGSKTPRSFFDRVLQDTVAHARQLCDLLHNAIGAGCLVESSFYAYCSAVAGGIHSLAFHYECRMRAPNAPPSLNYFQRSVNFLDRLGSLWNHAENMATRLRDFHGKSKQFIHLLQYSRLPETLNPDSTELLWSTVDYEALGAPLQGSTTMPPLPDLEVSTSSLWTPPPATKSLALSDTTEPQGLSGEDSDVEFLLGL